jgi:hypothetical protein
LLAIATNRNPHASIDAAESVRMAALRPHFNRRIVKTPTWITRSDDGSAVEFSFLVTVQSRPPINRQPLRGKQTVSQFTNIGDDHVEALESASR